MVDLSSLPRPKQLIQLHMCLALKTQCTEEHTFTILPDAHMAIDEVLDALKGYVKGLRNETLCRMELLSCRQLDGEAFIDY